MNRIQYIDCMRGVTMILVVYSHVILMGYHIDLDNFMNGIFITFRMPLFFWVSGFLAYSIYDTDKLKKKIKKRILGQLIPTFIMLFLFELWNNRIPFAAFLDNTKAGYWFTIVVFILFIMNSSLGCFLDRFKTSIHVKSFIFSIFAMSLMIVFNRFPSLGQSTASQTLSLPLVAFYAPYYCFGMLAKMYSNIYMKIIKDSRIVSVCLVLYVLILCINGLPKMLCGFLAVVVISAIFSHYKNFFSENTTVGRSLSYIGRNTISIYFLHYFVFRYTNLHCIATFLIENNIQFIGCILTFVFSLIIIATCLLVEKTLQTCKPIHSLMFGPK